jgi:chromosome segregation ATPase
MNKFNPMHIVIVSVAMAISTSHAQTGPKPPEITTTTNQAIAYVSKIVQITYNPSILPITPEFMNSLLTSHGVGGKLTLEILGPSYTDPRRVLQFVSITSTRSLSGGYSGAYDREPRSAVLYGQISAQSEMTTALTEQLLVKALSKLKISLEESGKNALANYQQALAKAKSAAELASKAHTDAQAEYDALLEQTGGLSVYDIRNEISALKRQLNPMLDYSSSNLDGARRRMESAKLELDRYKEQIKTPPKQDAELESLEKELANATKTFEQITKDVPLEKRNSADILAAQRQVSEVNNRIRARRDSLTRQEQSIQEKVDRLEKALIEATNQYRDLEAKQKPLQERLDHIKKEQLLEKASKLEQMKQSIDSMRSAAITAQREYDAQKNRAEIFLLPELTEIGAPPAK